MEPLLEAPDSTVDLEVHWSLQLQGMKKKLRNAKHEEIKSGWFWMVPGVCWYYITILNGQLTQTWKFCYLFYPLHVVPNLCLNMTLFFFVKHKRRNFEQFGKLSLVFCS